MVSIVISSVVGLVIVAVCGYAVNSISHFLEKVNDFAEKYEDNL